MKSLITKHTNINAYAFFIILASLLFIQLSTPGILHSANYPLEIIQPQAGLDTTNRFYKAYPGLEYDVRLAVIGGAYPYTYELATAPPGITINASTGEIHWDHPTTSGSPHSITARVVDSEGTATTVSWTITVTTNDFIFISPSGNGTEDGKSCTNAMQLEDMYGGALDPTTAGARDDSTYSGYFVYWCDGTYAPKNTTMYLENDWRFVFRNGNKPKVWLAYPGTTPVFDASGGVIEFYNSTGNTFVSGINFDMGTNPNVRLFRFPGNSDNATFYKNYFDGNDNTGGSGGNNALLFLSGGSSTGTDNRIAILNNRFTNLNAGIGLEGYSTNKMLVESNTFTDITAHSIYAKMGTTDWTIRGNSVTQPSGNGILVGNYQPTGDIEILFNYVNMSTGNALHLNEQFQTTSTGSFYAYRNSFSGNVRVNRVESGNGPFFISYNAIEGSYDFRNINYSSNLDTSNNIQATAGVNEENGNLTTMYSTNVGTHGWQFDDSSTPMDGIFTPSPPPSVSGQLLSPTGLTILPE